MTLNFLPRETIPPRSESSVPANSESSVSEPASVGKSEPCNSTARGFRLPYHLVEPAVFVIDMIIVVGISVVAGVGYHWIFLGVTTGVERYLAIGVLALINVAAVLAARGDYWVRNLVNFKRQLRDLTIIWIGVLLVLVGVAFALKVAETFSRGATLTFFALSLVAMIGWRGLLAQFLRHALMTGSFFAQRKVVLIGERGRLATSPAIAEVRRCGYVPTETFTINQDQFSGIISPELRATIDEVIEAARKHSVNEILLLIGWEHSVIIERITKMLRVLPIPVYLLPDENIARYLGSHTMNIGTAWATEIQRAPLSRTEQLVKRCLDVVGAALALLLFMPLMLLTAVLIKLDSRGPIFFYQSRNGFNGRSFRIVKFRTMNVLEDGNVIRQATRADPRVTRLGRWLRRTNIDELPQLFNVFHGDMSLVGPRPHAVAHDSQFERLIADYAFRSHVKPGITGWAQVNGYRGETPTADLIAKRVELDLWYIQNWSVWLDIAILLRTLMLGVQPSAY